MHFNFEKKQFFTSVLVNLLKNFEFLQYIKCMYHYDIKFIQCCL